MNIGPEKLVATSGKRPCVAALTDGRLVIAWDADGEKKIVVATEGGGGKFAVETVATSGKQGGPDVFNASRLYVPSIATDGTGYMISWRCGIKEWGNQYGPAVFDGNYSHFMGQGFTTGAARVAYDPLKKRYVLFSKDGAYRELDQQARELARGTLKVGKTGEKMALCIGPDGVRHAVMGGCQADPSAYISSAMPSRVVWASAKAYPEMGDDIAGYVGLGIISPRKIAVGAIYRGALRINVIKGGKPVYPADSLPSLGDATKQERCGPTFCPLAGDLTAFWRQGNNVVGVSVKAALKGKAAASVVCAGEMPQAAWNPAKGCISMVYCRAGGVCVREVRP